MKVVSETTLDSGHVVRKFECPICEGVYRGKGLKTHWARKHDAVIPRPWWPPITDAKRHGVRYDWAKRQIKDQQGNQCAHCGFDDSEVQYRLEFHHVVPFKKFAIPGRAHALQNIVMLCQKCHNKLEGVRPMQLASVLEQKGHLTNAEIEGIRSMEKNWINSIRTRASRRW